MASTYNAPLPSTAPPSAPAFSTFLCSTPEELARAMAVRFKVFVEEQGYDAAIEVDEKDPECDHLLLTALKEDGTVEDVGTVRWYPPLSKLGRLAVHAHYRGTGAGRILCLALEEHLRERKGRSKAVNRGKGAAELVAHSQSHAEGFYLKLGWTRVGGEFLEEGQPHVQVVKKIRLDPEEEEA
ncbi:hypothetical protein JCM21900_000648 [Sporobolomyces salmonicolor]